MTFQPSAPLRVQILSTQCFMCLGLQKILESSARVPMVVHHQRTPDLLGIETRPDVIIIDLDTDHDALSTITKIKESSPASKIVLLGGLGGKDHLHELLNSCVDGIVLKIQPPQVMLAVIEALYGPAKLHALGERDGAEGMSRETLLKDNIESATPPAWPQALTEREREIIRLVKQGLSNKEIAYKLSISDSTVRHHMTSIFDKVGVPNRQKLLLRANHLRSTPV